MPGENNPPVYYLDACCFIAYLANEEGRVDTVASLLEESLENKIRIVTSVLSLTEVAYIKRERDGRDLDPNIEKQIDDMFNDRQSINLIEYSQLIAFDARGLIRQSVDSGEKILKPPDAVHLASALRIRAEKLYTYDEPLRNKSGKFGIEITEPFTETVRVLHNS